MPRSFVHKAIQEMTVQELVDLLRENRPPDTSTAIGGRLSKMTEEEIALLGERGSRNGRFKPLNQGGV